MGAAPRCDSRGAISGIVGGSDVIAESYHQAREDPAFAREFAKQQREDRKWAISDRRNARRERLRYFGGAAFLLAGAVFAGIAAIRVKPHPPPAINR